MSSPQMRFVEHGSVSAPPDSRSPIQELQLVRILTACLFIGVTAILVIPFFSKLSWTTLVQDDFFYYLVIGQNIATGHGSTFNGIVATNGYQPLWQAVITGLCFVTTNPRLILFFVALTSFASMCVSFWLVNIMVARTAVRPLLQFAIASWTALLCLALFLTGMEVTLTVPIILGVFCILQEVDWLAKSPLHTFYLGLLFAAMVLSRIDTLILGGMILAGILISPKLRNLLRWDLLLGLGIGFLPVIVYFLYNHVTFNTWMPVSGMAKQLRVDRSPSAHPLIYLIPYALSDTKLLVTVPIVIALFFLPGVYPRLRPMQRVTFVSLILFPFVYYGILCFISDWGLWSWYLYALRPACCVSALILCLSPWASRIAQQNLVTWGLIAVAFAYLFSHGWKRDQLDIDDAAHKIQEFGLTHPGVYAMGDRAGRVAYMLPYPVVQLEGLVMDRPYLEYIRDQTPLRSVLAAYHVRYYIGTDYGNDSCFKAIEPYQAGRHAPHMRAEFCEPPLAEFISHGRRTMVFDVASAASNPQSATSENQTVPPIAIGPK